jgi:hypothetical protein
MIYSELGIQSSKLSCEHMSKLSYENMKQNNAHFNNIIKSCDMFNNDDYNRDGLRLESLNINKKSCIYKKDIYNDGEWVKQFNHPLISNYNIFNQQTKALFG